MRPTFRGGAAAPEIDGWLEHRLDGAGTPGAIRLLRLPKLRSPELQNYRDLLVALPPSYGGAGTRYPVVYMQDGQNLFDPDTSFAGDWNLHGVLTDLAERGTEAIVVAIAHTGSFRRFEYSPFRDPQHGGGEGEEYLRFVIETVKPRIDRDLRTLPGPETTVMAGSSMGGLISLYALFRRPDVFGAAGALSPSAWFAGEAQAELIARAERPAGRIYLDVGTAEDPGLVASVRRLRNRLAEHPTLDVRYQEDPDGIHHESHWGRRFGLALPFLLGRTTSESVSRRVGESDRPAAPFHRPPDSPTP